MKYTKHKIELNDGESWIVPDDVKRVKLFVKEEGSRRRFMIKKAVKIGDSIKAEHKLNKNNMKIIIKFKQLIKE